jgi:hypothetical protein
LPEQLNKLENVAREACVFRNVHQRKLTDYENAQAVFMATSGSIGDSLQSATEDVDNIDRFITGLPDVRPANDPNYRIKCLGRQYRTC